MQSPYAIEPISWGSASAVFVLGEGYLALTLVSTHLHPQLFSNVRRCLLKAASVIYLLVSATFITACFITRRIPGNPTPTWALFCAWEGFNGLCLGVEIWLWVYITYLCGVLVITGACSTNDAAPANVRYRRHWVYLMLLVLPGLGLGFAAAAMPAERAPRLQQLHPIREPHNCINCIEYTATTQGLVVPLILLAATLAVAVGIIQPTYTSTSPAGYAAHLLLCTWYLGPISTSTIVGANVIKLELWIGEAYSNLRELLPKFDTALALNSNYAVFATAFDAQTYDDREKADLCKAREILVATEKRVVSLKAQLENVSKGAYLVVDENFKKASYTMFVSEIRNAYLVGAMSKDIPKTYEGIFNRCTSNGFSVIESDREVPWMEIAQAVASIQYLLKITEKLSTFHGVKLTDNPDCHKSQEHLFVTAGFLTGFLLRDQLLTNCITVETLCATLSVEVRSIAIAQAPLFSLPKALAELTINTAGDSKPTSEAIASMANKVAFYDSSIEPTNTEPEPSPALTRKKAPAKFGLGGSCSSEHGAFLMDGSHGSAPCDVRPAEPLISESAIESDTDEDCVDESAIDDDDSFDWEDSDSSKSSVGTKFFQRVESKAHLVSRCSLITLMLARTERTPKEPQQEATHSASAITAPGASPNYDDEDPLLTNGMRPSNLRPIIEIPRSSAQRIVAPANHVDPQAVLSPRTTRCNMITNEMTVSVCRHLLWERQVKNSTADAVLVRRHTFHDVDELKQSPEKPYLKKSEDANASSWNLYFNTGAFGSYHSRGW
ncbi:hypothetical protein A9K55_002449 [Cordyceps militaris]|uniref:DUF3295 domain-containing protein n=1 Tax=Cordyceps militaris TaxID=73501 RepID=A0A2H4S8S5_CORMI|nr:hypothetical protein A9K55_002449 [Cordyceps militaris]